MSMTTLLGICVFLLVCVVAAFGFLVYYIRSDNAKLRHDVAKVEAQNLQIQLDAKKAANEGQLAEARSSQANLLVSVRQATNTLAALLQSCADLQARFSDFSTNSAGQEAALYPDLVAQARHLYENDAADIPASIAIVQRLESARRIEQQLVEASGTAYVPDDGIKQSVQEVNSWAQLNAEKVNTAATALASIRREAKVKVFTGTRPAEPMTLQVAIKRLDEADVIAQQNVILEKTTGAKSSAADVIAQAEADKIIAQAKAKAQDIMRAAEDDAAARKRAAQIQDAEGKAKDTAVGIKSQQILDEAEHQRLLAKADDPQVKFKLAPLSTPGYFQYPATDVVKKPVSMKALEAAGAFNQTKEGMNGLVNFLIAPQDKVRPRLRLYYAYGWMQNPDQIEQVTAIQNLLIELRPVLVEKGILSP
jgi:hypothetical protein